MIRIKQRRRQLIQLHLPLLRPTRAMITQDQRRRLLRIVARRQPHPILAPFRGGVILKLASLHGRRLPAPSGIPAPSIRACRLASREICSCGHRHQRAGEGEGDGEGGE